MQTVVVNLFSGPGTGKSTFCAGLFAQLKWAEVNCEMALEYAKDLVWSENFKKLENQLYVFAKQQNRIYQLNNKVDVIVTDSPLLLSIIYDAKNDELFKQFILREHSKFNNFNVFLNRKKVYIQSGRIQTYNEAVKIDCQIKELLNANNVKFQEVDAIPDNIIPLANDVLLKLKK